MTPTKLRVSVLVDNSASQLCQAEHGLSYLVEYDKKVLFDTGASNLFLLNANKMGINLDGVNTVVLSHGHYDHGNGLGYLDKKTIVAHPDVFAHRYSGRTRRNISLNIGIDQLSKGNKLELTKNLYWISESMVYLGEIPRIFGFENQEPGFYFENGSPDYILDDSALAIKTDFGLMVISGCAHAGICNTIEYARTITGISELYGVIGGFHLVENNQRVSETISFLKSINARIVMPSHCTGLPALSAIYDSFKGEQVKAGTVYTFPKSADWFVGQV